MRTGGDLLTKRPVGFVRVGDEPYEHAAAVLRLATAFNGQSVTDDDIAGQLDRQGLQGTEQEVAIVRRMLGG